MLAGHPHAQRRDPVELAVEHVAGQPVGRDAVPHHPARLVARVPDLHLVAEPGQVVGGRQPARPGTDHEHPLAAADRWRVEAPPLLEREVAQEPLDRVDRDGAVEARRGCRRSRTGGSRPARGSRATDCPRRAHATPARAGPPGCATARPGCSRRPGSRRCTAAAGRRRRAGARGPGRCGSARAAGPAAASRPASGRSCLSAAPDGHHSTLARLRDPRAALARRRQCKAHTKASRLPPCTVCQPIEASGRRAVTLAREALTIFVAGQERPGSGKWRLGRSRSTTT